jgi:hypothetical protein
MLLLARDVAQMVEWAEDAVALVKPRARPADAL